MNFGGRPERHVLPISRNAIESGSRLLGWGGDSEQEFPFKGPLALWYLYSQADFFCRGIRRSVRDSRHLAA